MSKFLTATLVMLASPSFAGTSCEEMWFVRNLIFDRAGLCFKSPLGQAIFDNSDCRLDAQIEIGAADAETVANIKLNEAEFGCAMNTNHTTLDLPHIELFRAVEQLPVVSVWEADCVGFKGSQIVVYSAPLGGAVSIGSIKVGDHVRFDYDSLFEGWEFVRTDYIAGWISNSITPEQCDMFAG